jgi:protein-S-isoprenylcysteine O-methyltransferase Ste14
VALLAAQIVLVILIGVAPSTAEPAVVLELAGWLVAGFGLAWLVGGAISLGRSLAALPLPTEGGELRTGGFFRFSRHPIYTGMLALTGGYALARPSVLRVACWVALAAVLSRKARYEEELLDRTYAGYAGYRARTPRFLPRPWRRARV